MNGCRWNATLIALVLGVSGACGSDSGGSSGTGNGGGGGGEVTFGTGLPTDKTLSSLSNEDIQSACQQLNDSAATAFPPSVQVHASCFGQALSQAFTISADGSMASFDVAKCQMLTDACEADPESAGVSVDDMPEEASIDCIDADTEELAGCDATVGEYESCLNKVLAAAKDLFASLTCDNGQRLIENDGVEEINALEIPECASLMNKCPDLEVPGQ